MTESTEVITAEEMQAIFANLSPEKLKIVKDVTLILDGEDPNMQQSLSQFAKLDNDLERTNLPNTNAVICMAQLDICEQSNYPNDPNNPFAWAKKSLASCFMSRKGWKSDGFVELFKKGLNLGDIKTANEGNQLGFLDRFRRGKTEE